MALTRKEPPKLPTPEEQAEVRTMTISDRLTRVNPAIDAKITKHMAENPKYVDYLQGLDKNQLIRKVVYEEVKANEAKQNLARGFAAYAQSNPALALAVEQIRAKVPAASQEAAIANIGRQYAAAMGERIAPIKAPAQIPAGPKITA